jgi:hypothetical protein
MKENFASCRSGELEPDDRNKDGRADVREGKDVAHIKALSKGGTNKNGVKLQTPAANRSFKRASDHKVVSEVSARERKKK